MPTEHAFAGLAAYELGHANHLDVNLASGDRHDVSQTFVVSAQAALVRYRVRVAAPPTLAGGPWIFEALLNGVVQYARSIDQASHVVQLLNVAVRLASANAGPSTNVITFRLRLS